MVDLGGTVRIESVFLTSKFDCNKMSFQTLIHFLQTLPPAVSTICGVVGFCIYLTNYTLVTFRIISSQGCAFFALNILGATLVLVSLAQNFNLGAMLIQVFWICLGVIAIAIRLRARAMFGANRLGFPGE